MSEKNSTMSPSQLIAFLNALSFGDIDAITAKLDEARQSCLDLGEAQLADKLREAGTALREGDVREYRRSLETVVSRLGHLK